MMKTNREVYGEMLVEIGGDERVVALDADVSSSTRSCLFAEKYPDRFFNVGIAEANMCTIACGMASEGKIPFVNTFATFATSLGLLPIRSMAAYMGLKVRLVGAYGGLSDSYDGATHHSIEDLAIMRAVPHMTVLTASDAVHTKWLVRNALLQDGPMYIRLSRNVLTDIYREEESFEIGKGKVLRQGGDCTIVANGVMLAEALEAAQVLSTVGIDARVVDMFSLKPFDHALLRACAEETGIVITAEEHSIIGGLGSAVAESLAETRCSAAFSRVGIENVFSQSGSYQDLLQHYGLTAAHIVAEAKKHCRDLHRIGKVGG